MNVLYDQPKIFSSEYYVTEKLDGSNTVFTFFNETKVNMILDEIKTQVKQLNNLKKHYFLLKKYFMHFNNFKTNITNFSENLGEFKEEILNYKYEGEPVFMICSKRNVLTPFLTNRGAFETFMNLPMQNFQKVFDKYGHVTLFAEWMVRHQLNYKCEPHFRTIGVIDDKHYWLERRDVIDISKMIEMKSVPELKDLTETWNHDIFKKKKSCLNPTIEIEGVVFILNKKIKVEFTGTGLICKDEVLCNKMHRNRYF